MRAYPAPSGGTTPPARSSRDGASICPDLAVVRAEVGHRAGFTRAGSPDMPVKSFRFGDHLETSIGFAGGLRTAKQQNPALSQGEMEHRDDLRLRVGPQIDQQIAAGHQIDAGKRRVGQHVLHGEDHQSAQLRHDLVATIVFRKEPGEACGRSRRPRSPPDTGPPARAPPHRHRRRRRTPAAWRRFRPP